MVVPPVHVADNLQLGPRTYAILVKGVEVARGELMPDRLLAINPGTASGQIDGTPTREPAFGLPAWWIATEHRDRVTAAGYTVVDPTTALSTHLSETIRTFLPDLLSRQQTKEMLDRVAQTSPRLIEELVPKVVSTGEIQRLLKQLLRERVPIRDLTTILESMGDIAPITKDADVMNEAVRARARPRHLPSAPERSRRAADHQFRAVFGGAIAPVDRPHGAGRGARAGPSRSAESRLSNRPRTRDRSGTACASVHASTATAPLEALHTGAAADRSALAQRDSSSRAHRSCRRSRLTYASEAISKCDRAGSPRTGPRRARTRRAGALHAARWRAWFARLARGPRGGAHGGSRFCNVGIPTLRAFG